MTLFKNYLENEIADLEAAGTGLASATPFTVETAPDPILGGSAVMQVLVFPVGGPPVLAFKLEGDVFPRLLIASNLLDGIYWGDGTFDPYNQLTPLSLKTNGQASFQNISLSGPQHTAYGDLLWDAEIVPGIGPVLVAPDFSHHRLVVANDGTLSTEPVV